MGEIKDGAFYKTVEIEGVRFDIYYGYESENVKKHGWDPTPQYPDFDGRPTYTPSGKRFAIAYGEVCNYYEPIKKKTDMVCCLNCKLFNKKEEYIGLCECVERMRDADDG